ELQPGVSLCELGCGPGWISRLATRQGIQAEGYDISPEMIEIAREVAAEEGLDVRYEVGDMEQLDLGRRFDTCLLYDALHHSPCGRGCGGRSGCAPGRPGQSRGAATRPAAGARARVFRAGRARPPCGAARQRPGRCGRSPRTRRARTRRSS